LGKPERAGPRRAARLHRGPRSGRFRRRPRRGRRVAAPGPVGGIRPRRSGHVRPGPIRVPLMARERAPGGACWPDRGAEGCARPAAASGNGGSGREIQTEVSSRGRTFDGEVANLPEALVACFENQPASDAGPARTGTWSRWLVCHDSLVRRPRAAR
jgi:hypothetical protein